MVEVPVVWEIPPRGGPVAVALGAAGFVGFVGLGLVFQDLWDDSSMRFGSDEDLRKDQRACWLTALFALCSFGSPPTGLGSRRCVVVVTGQSPGGGS